MGYHNTFITRQSIINSFLENHDANDVLNLVLSKEVIQVGGDAFVEHIVSLCLINDIVSIQKILKDYTYNNSNNDVI